MPKNCIFLHYCLIRGSQDHFKALIPCKKKFFLIKRSQIIKKKFFLYRKNPFILILRPSKTKRRGFTYNCGFLHLLTPLQPLNAWTVSISLRESNSICPNFILSPRKAFSEHSVMDFFHPLFT